ncbi:acyl-CoA dehydrogenase family protein [Mycobacterium sp. IDR2000157661]|uniref:acyl-CoA dehydrogenase family protein n=1 Tax=Mycobacterium sp. IDR2000157661 TaxID=2867005 RepID=UPI001EEB6867|nr:acyl-CoA dehydrogenase family protein [Mycobacterium sp. IDR2000157661]ULE33832.1 acyl-CoA/acyl-ACP dehydrogenase [Mycobacterium sp. IDR2000157661]
MDFRYSAEQDDFRASLRGFLRHAGNMAHLRDVAAAEGYDGPLWKRLCAELDLPGLNIATGYGGAGGTMLETAIAFEELGRALTAVPMAATTFTIEAVMRMGDETQRHRLLPGLLSGELVGAFAAAGTDAAEAASTVMARRDDGRTTLVGECSPVLHGHVADVFAVPARAGHSVGVYMVAAGTPGVTVERLPSFDVTRPVARLTLDNASAEPLAAATPGRMERVLDVARVLLSAEMLGGAEACLALAVEHACTRTQFGRPIGSFQAVKHSCAEMMIEIDATRVAVMFAAMSAGDPDELASTAPLVKAQAADTFTQCAGSALQVHGGIAFTWEHDVHLYFRRAKTTEALFGSSARHRALLADRVDL